MAASSCGFGLLPPAVEPPAVESFGAALLGIRRLPRACTSTQEEFGILKSYVQPFPDVFGRLLPVIEQVLWKLCTLHYLHHRHEEWEQYWKGVSMEGYDLIRNEKVDYGNMGYTVLYKCICA